MGRSSAYESTLDRAWRKGWRSLTLVGCALAFWMGLRSPVSERVVEPTALFQARRQPADNAQRLPRLVTRFSSDAQHSNAVSH